MAGSRGPFDASNYLQLSDANAYRFSVQTPIAISISLWYKASAYTDSHMFSRYSGSGPVFGWATAGHHRPYSYNIFGVTGYVGEGSDDVALNAWHHTMWTYRASADGGDGKVRVYDDGVLVFTEAFDNAPMQFSAAAWSLGAAPGGVAPASACKIAEVAIWHDDLTLADAVELAAGTPADSLSAPGSLPVGYWPILGTNPEVDVMGNYDFGAVGTGGTYNSGDGPPVTGGGSSGGGGSSAVLLALDLI